MRPAFLVALSTGVGWVAWSGIVLLLPVSMAFASLWSLARTRQQAAVVSAAYFLAASRGLPQGVASYYGSDLWPGLGLWLTASFAFVLVYSVTWTEGTGWQKSGRFVVAGIVMAVPPFGILGWAHPLSAAGVFFPASGWWGLLVMIVVLALMTTRYMGLISITMMGVWLCSVLHWTSPPIPSGWYGVNLRLGASLGRDLSLRRQEQLIGLTRGLPYGAVVVLPESALGYLTPPLLRIWQQTLSGRGVTVLAGATHVAPGGYDNVLVAFEEGRSEVIYRQRMPVPGSMWRPFNWLIGRANGAHAYFFADPVVTAGRQRIAPLICYEQLLVWPVLHSMLKDPDVVVAIANVWWTQGTAISEIQRSTVIAWARLFDKPLVLSANR